jgi:hypothetical protein
VIILLNREKDNKVIREGAHDTNIIFLPSEYQYNKLIYIKKKYVNSTVLIRHSKNTFCKTEVRSLIDTTSLLTP